MMVPTSHKKISLTKEAYTGLSSLMSQGGIVLFSFGGMLLLSGGAPSGLAVGWTVILSGAAVTWLEQDRLTKLRSSKTVQNNLSKILLELPNSSRKDVQKWLEQVEPKGIASVRRVILYRKFGYISSGANCWGKMYHLTSVIKKFNGEFLLLTLLAGLNLNKISSTKDFKKSILILLILFKSTLINLVLDIRISKLVFFVLCFYKYCFKK